jgi:hypothetical protein
MERLFILCVLKEKPDLKVLVVNKAYKDLREIKAIED